MFAQCLQKVQGKNRRRPHTPDSQAPNHSQRYLEHALQVFQQYEPASLRVDVFDHLKLNGQAKKLNSCVTCCSCGQLTEVALPDRRRRTCKRSAQKNESLPCGITLESNARRLAVKISTGTSASAKRSRYTVASHATTKNTQGRQMSFASTCR